MMGKSALPLTSGKPFSPLLQPHRTSTLPRHFHNRSSPQMPSYYRKEAHSGFADAASYDAHRPSFPQASVSTLLKGLGIAGEQNADVVDLAAGTGKFTELLLKRDEKYRVTAIEPHVAMRSVLQAKKWPALVVADGFSHDMPLEDASVDAVIAAQVSRCSTNFDLYQPLHHSSGTFLTLTCHFNA